MNPKYLINRLIGSLLIALAFLLIHWLSRVNL
jgi:hypothetical protein